MALKFSVKRMIRIRSILKINKITFKFKAMKTKMQKVILWSPRIICMIFAAFISIFSFDVFEMNAGFWQKVLGFLMHNIPTFFLILVLIFSWRWPMVGGIVYILLGLAYIVLAWGKFHWSAYVMISGPLFLLGGLFFLSWYQKKNISKIN